MKLIRKHTFQAWSLSISALKMALLALCLSPLSAISGNLTMEDNMMQIMEASVTRTANKLNFENPADWQRNSQFNATKATQPGWMLNATAIGNLINVQVQGAGNTVLVNAVQMNSGNQMSVVSHNSSISAGSSGSNTNPSNGDANTNTNAGATPQTTQISQSSSTPTSSISGSYGK